MAKKAALTVRLLVPLVPNRAQQEIH